MGGKKKKKDLKMKKNDGSKSAREVKQIIRMSSIKRDSDPKIKIKSPATILSARNNTTPIFSKKGTTTNSTKRLVGRMTQLSQLYSNSST